MRTYADELRELADLLDQSFQKNITGVVIKLLEISQCLIRVMRK